MLPHPSCQATLSLAASPVCLVCPPNPSCHPQLLPPPLWLAEAVVCPPVLVPLTLPREAAQACLPQAMRVSRSILHSILHLEWIRTSFVVPHATKCSQHHQERPSSAVYVALRCQDEYCTSCNTLSRECPTIHRTRSGHRSAFTTFAQQLVPICRCRVSGIGSCQCCISDME